MMKITDLMGGGKDAADESGEERETSDSAAFVAFEIAISWCEKQRDSISNQFPIYFFKKG